VNDRSAVQKRKLVRQGAAERILGQMNPALIFVSFISSTSTLIRKEWAFYSLCTAQPIVIY